MRRCPNEGQRDAKMLPFLHGAGRSTLANTSRMLGNTHMHQMGWKLGSHTDDDGFCSATGKTGPPQGPARSVAARFM